MAYESTEGTEAAGSDAAAADSFLALEFSEVKCTYTQGGASLSRRCLAKNASKCLLTLKTAVGGLD